MSSACPTICSAQLTQLQNTAIIRPYRTPFCHTVQPSLTTRRARCRPASLTVPASQATEFAKPIPKQKTDKGFVALLFAGGAASIFGAAVLLEKNSKLFPAIHKANQVMREAALRSKGQSLAEQAVVDLEQQDSTRLQRSVEAGLASAQARVLPDTGDGSGASTSRIAHSDADGSQSAAGGPSSTNGMGQQSHSDAESGSSDSSERPKGSQLSAAEKQEKAVNSVS